MGAFRFAYTVTFLEAAAHYKLQTTVSQTTEANYTLKGGDVQVTLHVSATFDDDANSTKQEIHNLLYEKKSYIPKCDFK